MKNKAIFSLILVMLLTLGFSNLSSVKAAEGYSFVATSGATAIEGQENAFDVTSSKGYIQTEVSDVDTSNSTFVSIKWSSPVITNFDVYVGGLDADGNAVELTTAVYKIGLADQAWNRTEYEVYGDGAFYIATANLTSYLNWESGSTGIHTLTTVQLILRDGKGSTFQVLDFALTTDGVHGFDTTLDNGDVEDTPVEDETPVNYEFVSDGNSTIEKTENSTIFTLTATRSYIILDVTEMNVDKTSVFISLQYQYTGTVEGFESYVNYVDSNTKVTASGLVAPGTTAGSPWNLEEHVVTDNYIISTLEITNYTKNLDSFSNIAIRLKGGKGMTFELFDFAITTDGVHSFDSNIGSGEEPTPEPDPIPYEYTFTTDGNATVEGDVYTLTATRALLTTDVTELNLNPANLYVSVQYKFTGSNVEGFEIRVNGIDASGAEVIGKEVSAVVAPTTTAGSPWNLEEHVIYDDFVISTIKVGSYIADFQAVTGITIRVKGAVGNTFKLYDFAATADGKHNFKLPMLIGDFASSSDKYTIAKNDSKETLVSYAGSPGWHTVNLTISDFDVRYDELRITFTLESDTTLCFEINNRYDSSIGHYLYEGGKTHTFIANLAEYPTASDLQMKIYFDATRTELTADQINTVVFNSVKLRSSLIPDLELSVENQTFDYTGESVALEVECSADVELVYRHKLVGSTEWLSGLPTNVGSYIVKVSYEGTEYESTPVEVNVVINKVAASAPSADDVTYDAHSRVITIKDGIEASLSEDFIEGDEVLDGDIVYYGDVIYFRVAGDANHLPGTVLSITISKHPVNPEWNKDAENHWHECSCGVELDKAAHNWDEGQVTKVPTCTTAGEKTTTCTVCGETIVAEVAALGHTEVIDAAVEVTCTTAGLTEGKHCSVCNEVLVAQEEVPTIEHTNEAVVTAPTCTEAGYTTYTCSVCGNSYVADETPALGHSSSEGWKNDSTYHWHECECGAEYDRTVHSYPANGDTSKCSVCGYSVVTDSLDLGCVGSIVSSLFSLVALCGAAVFFKKRKNDEE